MQEAGTSAWPPVFASLRLHAVHELERLEKRVAGLSRRFAAGAETNRTVQMGG